MTRDIETSFKPVKKLIPFRNQTGAMSPSFLYTSYGVAWLGEKVHSFMTKELIAMPFKPASYGESRDHLTRENESWTAQTIVYQTELACTPAEVKVSGGMIYAVGMGSVSYNLPRAGRQAMWYIGSQSTNVGMQQGPIRNLNHFLAIWAKPRNAHNGSDEFDLNTLYCKLSYHYQTYEITVHGPDGSILKADPVGERTNFTQEDKIINILEFEKDVAWADASIEANPKYFPGQAPASVSRFEDWGLYIPTGQISYVIGLSPGKKFDDFRDPTTFRNGLDSMHRLLFNNALETLLVSDSGGEEVVGKRVVTSIGIVVVPLIVHILAGFLGLVFVCLGGVFLVYRII